MKKLRKRKSNKEGQKRVMKSECSTSFPLAVNLIFAMQRVKRSFCLFQKSNIVILSSIFHSVEKNTFLTS